MGIISIVQWNLRPVIFGVEFSRADGVGANGCGVGVRFRSLFLSMAEREPWIEAKTGPSKEKTKEREENEKVEWENCLQPSLHQPLRKLPNCRRDESVAKMNLFSCRTTLKVS